MQKRKDKIYIAGPMRQLPKMNFPAFFKAAQEWRDKGWEVFNPAEADIELDGFDPETDQEQPQRHYAKRYMDAVLNECTAMYLLKGWSRSVGGAKAEAAAALWIGLDVVLEDPNETTAAITIETIEAESPKMREFTTGATRNIDTQKYDFDGFLSGPVIEAFAAYMHAHRTQADGKLRDSDNWQRGMPLSAYLKSAWRHFFDWWQLHRGYPTRTENGEQVTMKDALMGLMFNLQGYAHEWLKAQKGRDDAAH